MTFEERVAEIVASLSRIDRFGDIEVLKYAAHRDRGGLFLKVTIDRDGGVDTHTCEAISKYLTRCLDALPQPVPPYSIEVESAGVERPLLTPEHYRRFIGKGARIITSLRISNRTEFNGKIVTAGAESVTLADPHAGEIEIPYPAIKRANLTFELREDLKKKA